MKDKASKLVLLGIVFLMYMQVMFSGLILISLAINNVWFYLIVGILVIALSIVIKLKYDELWGIYKKSEKRGKRK